MYSQRNQFKLGKLTEIINNAIPQIEPARGKTLTLVIGQTGVGKSTTINYLMRYPMTQDEDGSVVPEDSSVPMPCDARDSVESVTITPAAVTLPEGNVMCDCPGFADTRGDEIRVAISISTEVIVKYAHSIRGLIIVLDWNTIHAGRGEGLREAALSIGSLIRQEEIHHVSDSIMFVLTKGGRPTDSIKFLGKKINDQISKVSKDLNEYIKPEMTGGLELHSSFLDAAEFISEKFASTSIAGYREKREAEIEAEEDCQDQRKAELGKQLFILNLLKESLERKRVVNCNILDGGESRNQIIHVLNQLNVIPKDAFNFSKADPVRERFTNEVRTRLVPAYDNICRVNELTNEIAEKAEEQHKILTNIASFKQQKKDIDSGLNVGENNPLIIQSREALHNNDEKLQLIENQWIDLQQKIQQDENELNEINTSEEVFFKEFSFSESRAETVCMMTGVSLVAGAVVAYQAATDVYSNIAVRSAIGVLSATVGQVLGMAAAIPVAIGSTMFRITTNFEYKGDPFTRVEEVGFSFKRTVYKPEEGNYTSTYKSGRGVSAEATVRIYGEKKNIAENKIRIEALQRSWGIDKNQAASLQEEIHHLRKVRDGLTELIADSLRYDDDKVSRQKCHLGKLISQASERFDSLEIEKVKKQDEHANITTQLKAQQNFFNMIMVLSDFIHFNSKQYPKLTETVENYITSLVASASASAFADANNITLFAHTQNIPAPAPQRSIGTQHA